MLTLVLVLVLMLLPVERTQRLARISVPAFDYSSWIEHMTHDTCSWYQSIGPSHIQTMLGGTHLCA